MTEQLSFDVSLDIGYQEALEQIISALKTEGFGVLTRIDVEATLKEKIGADFRPYTILGACNPPLAHRALTSDPAIGLLLPCNVTVEEAGEGKSIIRVADPKGMMLIGSFAENQTLQGVAQEAHDRLKRAIQSLT